MEVGSPEITIALVILGMLGAVVYPAVRICQRVGFPALLGLLAVVPVANIVLLWVIALAPWPRVRTRTGA